MEKQWYIGIDFGTSNTCIVAYEASEGKVYTGDLVKELSDTYLNVPTLIARDVLLRTNEEKANGQKDDKPYYVGAEASLHPILRPFKGLKDAARQFVPNNGLFGKKSIEFPFEQCGLNSALELGNDDYSLSVEVRDLLLEFFKKILHVDDEKFGINKDTVKRIVIGQPVVKGRSEGDGTEVLYENILKELLAECFLIQYKDDKKKYENDKNRFIGTPGKEDGIIIVEAEPALAGITYLYSESQRADKDVLVIDIGGGTTDFSILSYKNGKPESENIGFCNIAGNAIDDVIFALLPQEVPHSKYKCRGWKERLFATTQVEGTQYNIYPVATENLKSIEIGPEVNKEHFYIYYDVNTDSFPNDGVVIGPQIQEKVYDKIKEELKLSLSKWVNTSSKKINTVFFVGGTSVITPLRKSLTDTAEEICDRKLEVVTMFSNGVEEGKTKTLKVDWGEPLPITCYNAVAIGACIKAIGQNFCIKPNVRCKRFYARTADETDLYEASENEIIIKTEAGVPFIYTIYDKNKVKGWLDSIFPFENETILFEVDTRRFEYKITREELSKLNCPGEEKGLLIVLVLNNSTTGIQCKAYGCNTTKEEIKKDGLDKVTQGACTIGIIQL